MFEAQKINRIVWAIDPFEESGPVRRNTLRALRTLVHCTGATIEPVHLMSLGEYTAEYLDYPLSGAGALVPPAFAEGWVDPEAAHRAALIESTKDLNLPGLIGPRLIPQTMSSKRNAVDMLVKYALSSKADLIVASTHGRAGMARLLMGSFAETLVNHSPVPSLIVGGEADVGDHFRHVLFPTDLGVTSRQMFERTVRLLAPIGCRMTLFHCIPNEVEPVLQSGAYLLGGSWVPVHNYFADDIEERKKKLRAWANWATRSGVMTEPYLEQQNVNVPNAIIACAKARSVDLVVMGAQAGSIASALIGSVTRQVVRHAPNPVLIMHPPRRQAGAKKRAA